MTELHWLPRLPDIHGRLRELSAEPEIAWEQGVALANSRLNFLFTNSLDARIRRILTEPPANLATKPIRLAVLGSCTLTHLHGAIRVAGLRRGLWVDTYEPHYGQHLQELSDSSSALHRFSPNAILLALDAYHLTAGISSGMSHEDVEARFEELKDHLHHLWQLAHEAFRCPIIQQAALPVHVPLLGNNEHRLPGSCADFLNRLNFELRKMTEKQGVDLLAIDARAAHDGIAHWHDTGMWHRAKQEIALRTAPLYGDFVGRLLAAKQGRSAKCLVLDLDNTLWGGVVGDDGVEGLVLGQGSALGEAFAVFQNYVRELSRRGVILAVCSKNDQVNAIEPFDRHPDMVLRRSDIACFVANWSDKANNIRAIAQELNIGLDSLVFIDDNPFERNLVRRELPMVAVPEVGEDPISYMRAIADAGYFENLAVTQEDRERTQQYRGNREREALRASTTNLQTYLRSLEMQLIWRHFDRLGLQRIIQLINKSNQFNLTTRRYTEQEILAVITDPWAVGLQLRLIDRFGDNGVIAIVIGRMQPDQNMLIETWLMSCRVLGRQVEVATLTLLAQEARKLGARQLIGEYIPTKKNGIVQDHYVKLGFTVVCTNATGGCRNMLDLESFRPVETSIAITKG